LTIVSIKHLSFVVYWDEIEEIAHFMVYISKSGVILGKHDKSHSPTKLEKSFEAQGKTCFLINNYE